MIPTTYVAVYRHFDYFTFDQVLYAGPLEVVTEKLDEYMASQGDGRMPICIEGQDPELQDRLKDTETPHIVLIIFEHD